ncbi:hypothetical protein BTS2_2283 [Bacillus sp. TS-2]|nr:hypothetical protein BTS2_2283 [Bacillus sp. TS-2]
MNLTLNKSSLSKELLYMINLLIDSQKHSYVNLNWNEFLAYAMHHRVYPLLHSKMKERTEPIPEHVRHSIFLDYKQNVFQMLRLSAEMNYINEILVKQKINSLFLKGPVLAEELYGDLSLRTSSDIDLLIPLKDLKTAEKLLIDSGYEKDDYIQTVLNDWRWRHHHVTYFHPTKKIKVELHWRLHPGPGKEQKFEQLWERRRKSQNIGSAIYLLGREDLFLFLTVHGARHGWSRLRWLLDIHYLIEKELNWKILLELFKTYSNPHIGGQVFILLSQLFHIKITNEMKPFISKKAIKLADEALYYQVNRVHLHTIPLPIEVANYHKMHVVRLRSFKQAALYYLSTLHPFPEDAQTLPLPTSLHFLYFPLRPFLWIWRKSRKLVLS